MQPPAPKESWRSSRLPGARDRASDWGSLVADLSSEGRAPRWRVHDRTHLEFAVNYDVVPGASEHEWEAYFFVPESLRLDGKSYGKDQIYADLQSYVRFAVPDVPFSKIAGEPMRRLRETARSGDAAKIVRELRLFACQVRAAGVAARRSIAEALGDDDPDRRSRAFAATARMVADAHRITARLRAILPPGYEACIHLTITDDHPLAQAFVIIEAVRAEQAP